LASSPSSTPHVFSNCGPSPKNNHQLASAVWILTCASQLTAVNYDHNIAVHGVVLRYALIGITNSL